MSKHFQITTHRKGDREICSELFGVDDDDKVFISFGSFATADAALGKAHSITRFCSGPTPIECNVIEVRLDAPTGSVKPKPKPKRSRRP